jgi:hypothetical protein
MIPPVEPLFKEKSFRAAADLLGQKARGSGKSRRWALEENHALRLRRETRVPSLDGWQSGTPFS